MTDVETWADAVAENLRQMGPAEFGVLLSRFRAAKQLHYCTQVAEAAFYAVAQGTVTVLPLSTGILEAVEAEPLATCA